MVNLQHIFFIFLFFFLAISTALSNIFLALIMILGVYKIFIDWDTFKLIFQSEPFRSFFYFALMLIFSALLNYHYLLEAWIGLYKYIELFYLPVLAFLFSSKKKYRQFYINSFISAAVLVLVISYLRYFDAAILKNDLIVQYLVKLGDPSNPTVFKWHITQNFFMALAVLYCFHITIKLSFKLNLKFFIYAIFSIAGFFNVLFMVQGRTGHLVLLIGLVYLLIVRFRRMGFLFFLFSLAGLLIFSENFSARLALGLAEVNAWRPLAPTEGSAGIRVEFIYNSLQLFVNNFFFGSGLGSFARVYADYVANLGMVKPVNPHNQYILFLVEAGIVGFAAFLALNYVCWQSSARLSDFWKHATRIILLSYGVANLFNSFLFDFSESLFFSIFMALAFSELIKFKKSAAKEN